MDVPHEFGASVLQGDGGDALIRSASRPCARRRRDLRDLRDTRDTRDTQVWLEFTHFFEHGSAPHPWKQRIRCVSGSGSGRMAESWERTRAMERRHDRFEGHDVKARWRGLSA